MDRTRSQEAKSAFLESQRIMVNPTKGHTATVKTTKGSYTYSYASLDDTVAAAKAALHKHDLSLAQPFRTEDGWVYVGTLLTHGPSGGVLDFGELGMPVPGDPQAMGGLITYLRRYALGSIGMAPEEDLDGAQAMPSRDEAPPEPQLPQMSSVKQQQAIHVAFERDLSVDEPAWKQRLLELLGERKGWGTWEDVHTKELTKREASQILDRIGQVRSGELPAF